MEKVVTKLENQVEKEAVYTLTEAEIKMALLQYARKEGKTHFSFTAARIVTDADLDEVARDTKIIVKR
jgi:hypothetical protein